MDQENRTVNNQQGGQQAEVVDGYSDVNTNDPNGPDAPDPGAPSNLKPMSAEERAKAEKEIREGNQEGHQGKADR